MKDHISLIAAAAGGFMLSIALSAILKGTPMTSWEQSSINSLPMNNLRLVFAPGNQTPNSRTNSLF